MSRISRWYPSLSLRLPSYPNAFVSFCVCFAFVCHPSVSSQYHKGEVGHPNGHGGHPGLFAPSLLSSCLDSLGFGRTPCKYMELSLQLFARILPDVHAGQAPPYISVFICVCARVCSYACVCCLNFVRSCFIFFLVFDDRILHPRHFQFPFPASPFSFALRSTVILQGRLTYAVSWPRATGHDHR